MSHAGLVIVSVKVEGRSKSEVARDYKISRYWVQQLVRRYEAEGEAAFEPRSRRPHSNPRAISLDLEDQIIRLRKELSKQGLDAGAETIRTHLQIAGAQRMPSVSTIWRVLTRRGFVTPQPRKRPKGVLGTGSPPSNPTNAGRPTPPTGSWPTAPAWRSSTSSTTTPAWTCGPSPAPPPPARRAGQLPDRVPALGHPGQRAHRQRRGLHRQTPPRRPGSPRVELDLSGSGSTTPGPPPPDLRKGRALPPDPEEVAGRPTRASDRGRPATPARPVPPLLQHRPAPPRRRPRPPAGLHRPPQGHPSQALRSRCTSESAATRPTQRRRHSAHNSRLRHIGLGRSTPANASWSSSPTCTSARRRQTGELLRELTLDPPRTTSHRGPPGPRTTLKKP